MNLILMWSTWIITMMAFYFGFKLGRLKENEKIPKFNIPNPIDSIKKHKDNTALKALQKEQEKIDVIAQNIENYDGTSYGQKDIPK